MQIWHRYQVSLYTVLPTLRSDERPVEATIVPQQERHVLNDISLYVTLAGDARTSAMSDRVGL